MKKAVSILICLVFLFSLSLTRPTQAEASNLLVTSGATLYIAPSGQDLSTCGSTSQPCKTLQYAVNKANSGDTLKAAAGIYTYSGANPSSICTYYSNTNAVVCIENKKLTLLGGYSTSNWSSAEPEDNLTIIDGQNAYRGVAILDTSANGNSASLDMEGFTIRNGRAQGLLNGSGDSSGAWGGGFFSHIAPVILRNLIFSNNQSIGGNSTNSAGGSGAGGGIMLNRIGSINNSTLDHITFTSNLAQGGQGSLRGGAALGGAVMIYSSNIDASYLTLINNKAQAGNGSGSGTDSSGQTADGLGGGISAHSTSTITIHHLTATGNQAIGGNASNSSGRAGMGGGGALESEFISSMTVVDASIRNNLALGGNAFYGGTGGGGGILISDSAIDVEQSSMIANQAIGGNGGGGSIGYTGGGGFYSNWSSGAQTVNVSMSNVIIADNSIIGGGGTGSDPYGGGGGLWLMGNSTNITHATIANNHMDSRLVYGIGLLMYHITGYPASVFNLSYSAVTDQPNIRTVWPRQSTVHIWNGATANISRVAFANNTLDTNITNEPGTVGGIGAINLNSILNLTGSVGYISPGAPQENYNISMTSPLKDQAVGSTITVDRFNDSRPFNLVNDIGAVEYQPFTFTVVMPGSGALQIDWSAVSQSEFLGLTNYSIVVTCESGANSPNEGKCGSPIRLSCVTGATLTGLTNLKKYTITLYATDQNGVNLAVSVPISATPFNVHRVMLPFIVK